MRRLLLLRKGRVDNDWFRAKEDTPEVYRQTARPRRAKQSDYGPLDSRSRVWIQNPESGEVHASPGSNSSHWGIHLMAGHKDDVWGNEPWLHFNRRTPDSALYAAEGPANVAEQAGLDERTRADWAQRLGTNMGEVAPHAPIMAYMGGSAANHDPMQLVAKAAAQMLQAGFHPQAPLMLSRGITGKEVGEIPIRTLGEHAQESWGEAPASLPRRQSRLGASIRP